MISMLGLARARKSKDLYMYVQFYSPSSSQQSLFHSYDSNSVLRNVYTESSYYI